MTDVLMVQRPYKDDGVWRPEKVIGLRRWRVVKYQTDAAVGGEVTTRHTAMQNDLPTEWAKKSAAQLQADELNDIDARATGMKGTDIAPIGNDLDL